MRHLDVQSRPALARGVRLHTDPATRGPVLLYPEGVMELNESAHEIVRRCDGKATIQGVIEALALEYEVETGTLRADVLDCLGELQRKKLLVFSPP